MLTDNFHILKSSDGRFFSPAVVDVVFFRRYINIFGEIWILAKVRKFKAKEPNYSNYIELNCEKLNIIELPWYEGLLGLFFKMSSITLILSKYRKKFDGYILRVAQLESYLAYCILGISKAPYLVEVVNDPAQLINNKLLNILNLTTFKSILSNAIGISYVTKEYLQRKYSPSLNLNIKKKIVETYYSSVEIADRDVLNPRKLDSNLDKMNIIHVSNTMKDNVKGHITTIKVVKMLVENGFNVRCTFIGDGVSINEYKALVIELGLRDFVSFVGRITDRSRIFKFIDESDLFLYPTSSDGLPRVLIEAMARGIPVISSPISGVPELLDTEFLVEPEDVEGYYNKIRTLFTDYNLINSMSVSNIKKAKEFSSIILSKRRTLFFQLLTSKIL